MEREGQSIGPYQNLKYLGSGNYGVVYLAEKAPTKLRTKPKAVAIKILDRMKMNLRSVQNEIDNWQNASGHPNILRIDEADEHDDEYVIESEYVAEGSLETRLSGGKRLEPPRAVEIISGILSGLTHLHSQINPIIHRDLKPDNILLSNGTPKIMDFGMSRALSSGDASQSISLKGSPLYMAPEALTQNKRNTQTDIWSVGAILYRMLSGKLPFEHEGEDWPEFGEKKRNNALVSLEGQIDARLHKVVTKALHAEPTERFQTAEQMNQALLKCSSHIVASDTISDEEFEKYKEIQLKREEEFRTELQQVARFKRLQEEADAKVADLKQQLEEANSKAEEERLKRQLEEARREKLEQETKEIPALIDWYRNVILYEDDHIVGVFDQLRDLIGEEKFAQLTRHLEREKDAIGPKRIIKYEEKKAVGERLIREQNEELAEDAKKKFQRYHTAPAREELRGHFEKQQKRKKALGWGALAAAGIIGVVPLALFLGKHKRKSR